MNIAQLPHKSAYVAALRRLKAVPAETLVKHPDWARGTTTAGELLEDFRRALDRRINVRGGDFEANNPVPIAYYRDARRLDDIRNRVRVYQFETEECRTLFGHRLASLDD